MYGNIMSPSLVTTQTPWCGVGIWFSYEYEYILRLIPKHVVLDLPLWIVPLRSTHFFTRYCSAWIPLVKKSSVAGMMSSFELSNFSIFQPNLVCMHICVWVSVSVLVRMCVCGGALEVYIYVCTWMCMRTCVCVL